MNRLLKNRFAVNTSWIVIGRAFQIGITFLVTMFVARHLGPEEYGVIGYTYSYIVIFSSFATLGMNDIIVKELVDKNNDKSEVLGTVVGLRIISSLLSVVVINLIVIIMNSSPKIRIVAFLQSLSLIFQVFDSINYYYHANMLSKKTAIINILGYSLSSVFRIYGLFTNKDVRWFAFAVSLDFLLISAMLLFVYLKDGNRLQFSKELGEKLLKKSYNYIFAGLMIGLYGKADTLLLGLMVDQRNVGLYGPATTICNAWPFLLQAIIDSSSPIIINKYSTDRKEFEKKLKQLYASIFYLSLAVSIFILIFSKQIVYIIFGAQYLESQLPLKIVSFSTAFSYFGVSRSIWMQCENKIRYEKVLYFFGAISNVVLNLVLIKLFGIAGAALALTLTQFLTNFVYVYLLKETRENAKLILDAIMLKGVF